MGSSFWGLFLSPLDQPICDEGHRSMANVFSGCHSHSPHLHGASDPH